MIVGTLPTKTRGPITVRVSRRIEHGIFRRLRWRSKDIPAKLLRCAAFRVGRLHKGIACESLTTEPSHASKPTAGTMFSEEEDVIND